MTLSPTFVVPRYWPGIGGAEQHSRALVQALARRRHTPRVVRFCSTEPHPTDYAYAYNDTTTILDGTVPVTQPGPEGAAAAVLRRLAAHADDSRALRLGWRMLCEHALTAQLRHLAASSEVVHAIYNGFTPAAVAVARLTQPFVWTPLAHTTRPHGSAWSSPGFRRLYRRADALIAMTDYERDWLISLGASADRVHVSPMAPLISDHPADVDGFRTRHALDEDPIVLFMGRLVDYKGYRTLLQAAPAIWRRHPSARIVLAGPADASVAAELQALDERRIRYIGVIDDAEKNAALAASEMVCIPSTEESLGVVYLEAWHFAKPVIAADIPVMRSVVEHGTDGLLSTATRDAVGTAVVALLDDADRAREMGQAGLRKKTQRYNWAETARQHETIYQTLT
jgi:glycosyltransferase involved in cell wall biosynthesis